MAWADDTGPITHDVACMPRDLLINEFPPLPSFVHVHPEEWLIPRSKKKRINTKRRCHLD
jgi:hypothetical protein